MIFKRILDFKTSRGPLRARVSVHAPFVPPPSIGITISLGEDRNMRELYGALDTPEEAASLRIRLAPALERHGLESAEASSCAEQIQRFIEAEASHLHEALAEAARRRISF